MASRDCQGRLGEVDPAEPRRAQFLAVVDIRILSLSRMHSTEGRLLHVTCRRTHEPR